MKRTVFLIAGFTHNAADLEFRALHRAIKAKGYMVIAVDMTWKYRTMSRFAKKFKKLYRQQAGQYNIIIGNSFGAEVALITAAELRPNKIILCSLSPFFQEDLPRFEPQQKLVNWFGPRRLKDLSSISVKTYAKQVKSSGIETILFYGEKEKKMYKKLVERVIDTAKDLETKPIEIAGAGHSFKDEHYIEAICRVL